MSISPIWGSFLKTRRPPFGIAPAFQELPMRILIVEDEPTLGKQLKSTLEATGYAVDLSTDGEDGHFIGSTEDYDAVILDLGLPEIDGLTVLGMWRKEGRTFPVLVLTARDSWSDKVAGLDAGADDYLAKPFQTEELIARLRALIRRASGNASSELTAGDVRLDTRSGKRVAERRAGEADRAGIQAAVVPAPPQGQGRVSRTELIEHIYDQDFDRDSNTIEVFVTRIRKKLGADVITTIRGLGYQLEDPAVSRERADVAPAVVEDPDAAQTDSGAASRITGSLSAAHDRASRRLWISVLLLGGGLALDRILTNTITHQFRFDQLEYVLTAMISLVRDRPGWRGVLVNRRSATSAFSNPIAGSIGRSAAAIRSPIARARCGSAR
jgi:two-component system OmpR family response regulator